MAFCVALMYNSLINKDEHLLIWALTMGFSFSLNCLLLNFDHLKKNCNVTLKKKNNIINVSFVSDFHRQMA